MPSIAVVSPQRVLRSGGVPRFGSLVEQTMAGGLQRWELEPSPCLALVLLLDQFNRQLCRAEARTFAGDERALQLSDRALALG